jgi:acyl-CoA thioesterase FadM
MESTYDYARLVTIGDTNAMQNVYFAEYFKLQGHVREMWVKHAVRNGVAHLAGGLILSTKSAHCEYRRPFYVFDTILCRMHIEDLRRVSARLVFEFYHQESGRLHAFGWQLVVFKDAGRKTCRMPEDFHVSAQAILWGKAGSCEAAEPE